MSRLFVAIDLPPPVTAELARLQPLPCEGLRLTGTAQMHLTLHFIGEAAIPAVAAALQTVRGQPFCFRLAGRGRFRARSGDTLWAGVELNEALLALHAAIGLALSRAGYPVELRRYQPHITLARCKPELPAQFIEQFLAKNGVNNAALHLPEVTVTGFGLYYSAASREGSHYSCEQWFPL